MSEMSTYISVPQGYLKVEQSRVPRGDSPLAGRGVSPLFPLFQGWGGEEDDF